MRARPVYLAVKIRFILTRNQLNFIFKCPKLLPGQNRFNILSGKGWCRLQCTGCPRVDCLRVPGDRLLQVYFSIFMYLIPWILGSHKKVPPLGDPLLVVGLLVEELFLRFPCFCFMFLSSYPPSLYNHTVFKKYLIFLYALCMNIMMSTSNNLNADSVPQTYFTPVAAGRQGKNKGKKPLRWKGTWIISFRVLGKLNNRSQIDI